MITIAETVEQRSRGDVEHLVCGGRCPLLDSHVDRTLVATLVAALVDDDPEVALPRRLAALHWRKTWEAADSGGWLPWDDGPAPDERPRCEVVPLFVELQRIWTAALFSQVGMAYDWMAPTPEPVGPHTEQGRARHRLLIAITDTDQRRSRAVNVMGYWTRLALTGHWATLTMERHRLAGTMDVAYLNGMLRITRRAYPHALAYLGGRERAELSPFPDRFVGVPPRKE